MTIVHDTGVVSNYDLVSPMLRALDAAERALWPEGRVTCPDCGTYAAALEVAGQEEIGHYVVPVACALCGGWTVEPEVAQ